MPLEIWAPAERTRNPKYARIDFIHTLVNLLGIIPFGTYLVLVPAGDLIARLLGTSRQEQPWHIGCLVPWLNDHPLVLFLVYFVILDFAAWVMHRFQHKLAWWWALHSLHPSQRQLNRWTDDRGNVIDSILQAAFIASWGIAIGTPPVEYGAILFLGKMVESLSHANTRIGFGAILDKLVVDPRFHRQHHTLASADEPGLHDCNFGFVFPLWDILFGTALYDGKLRPTGVNDTAIDEDNNKGWCQQQVDSTKRAVRALRPCAMRPTEEQPRFSDAAVHIT